MPGFVTITAAASSATLATLADAKEELNLTASTDDAYIGKLLTRASSVIAKHCGCPLGVQGISEAFHFGWQPGIGPSSQQVAPYGTPLNVQYKPLILSFVPVVSGTDQITENGTLLTRGTDYELNLEAGLVYRLRNGLRSWWNVPNVVAVYSAGYVLPNDTSPPPAAVALPADVTAVCLALVSAGYTARGRDPTVYSEQVQGVGQTTYQRSTATAAISLMNMRIDDDMAKILEDYRAKAIVA